MAPCCVAIHMKAAVVGLMRLEVLYPLTSRRRLFLTDKVRMTAGKMKIATTVNVSQNNAFTSKALDESTKVVAG